MEQYPPKPLAREGALEGNIRMPQNYLSIGIFGLDTLLKDGDPKENIRSLVSPIPLDSDLLVARVKKANAQHRAHNIAIELPVERVRDMMAIESRIMLHILWKTIFPDISLVDNGDHQTDFMNQPEVFTPSGDFATDFERDITNRITSETSAATIALVHKFSSLCAGILRTPEMIELQKKRKEQFKNWNEKDEYQKAVSLEQIRILSEKIMIGIRTGLAELDEQLNNQQELLLKNFYRALEDVYQVV